MKQVVSKTQLEVAVKHLCRVINTKNPLPILGDILCDVNADEKTLTMTASDSEIWLRYKVALDTAEGSGRYCVPATKLADALGDLNEEPLTIEVETDGEMKFTLQFATGEIHFPCESADEYPDAPEVKHISELWIEPRELATAINVTIWSSANDELRPQMAGVYFNFMKDKADAVASDGHTLMKYSIPNNYGVEGAFIMPRKVAKILPPMLNMDESEGVGMQWNDQTGHIEQEDWSLDFRLIEGRYPNYDSVIPHDQPLWINVSRTGLMSSLKKVSPFTTNSSNLVRATFDANSLQLLAEDYDFAAGATDRMAASSNIEQPISVGFKAASLIAILQKMPSMDVTLHIIDASHAVTLTEKHEPGTKKNVAGSVLGLAMPMILSE